MTYHELVAKVKEMYEQADAGFIIEHIAYQFNVTGEAEGAFYLEISEGKVHVMPYEYFDRDVLFTISEENLIKATAGDLDLVAAALDGTIRVEGDMDKALRLKEFMERVRTESEKEEKGATGLTENMREQTPEKNSSEARSECTQEETKPVEPGTEAPANEEETKSVEHVAEEPTSEVKSVEAQQEEENSIEEEQPTVAQQPQEVLSEQKTDSDGQLEFTFTDDQQVQVENKASDASTVQKQANKPSGKKMSRAARKKNKRKKK